MLRITSVLLMGVVLVGCSKSSTSSPPASPALAFKPMFPLTWPGKPNESSQTRTIDDGELKKYTAVFTMDKKPDGEIEFQAECMEYPKAFDWATLFDTPTFSSKKDEISRKPIVIGPARHKGFDVVSRKGDKFVRKLAAASGQRIYVVSALAPKQEWLTLPEVRSFLESFTIIE